MSEQDITSVSKEMMKHPIVSQTLAVLARDLPKELTYHALSHTEDVLTEVIRFGVTDQLPDRQIELLAIAAACHDLGFIKSPVMNEPIGAAYAREQMERHGGYSPDEVTLVERMILDTALVDTGHGPRQIPSTDLSRYLLDADLSNFGRDDFFDKGELQRQELGQDQDIFRRNSFTLLNSHRWLTNAARSLRQKKKEQNLSMLKSMVLSQKDSTSISFDRIGFLARLPLLLNSSLDTQKVIKIALEELKTRLNATAATIFLLDEDQKSLSFWALQGVENHRLEGRKIPSTVGIVGWVIQNQEGVIIKDAASDPRFFSQIDKEGGFITRTMVCAPLSVREHSLLGAVQVLNKIGGIFDPEDLEFVIQFANQVALAIENAQLYEAVTLRSHQLEMVDSKKNTLMNILASQLREPVRAIGTSAELLGSGAFNDGLMVEQTCVNLTANVQRLSKLIADFRNLSFATSTKLSPEISHCDVKSLFDQVHGSFEPILRARSLKLNIECSDAVGGCEGDQNLLQIALSNLMANAVKNTPDGGSITLRALRTDTLITIELADSGRGMSTNDIMHAFDRFENATTASLSEAPYSFQSQGLGLGLPATRTILHSHGTALEIHSSEGKGSTFCFSLPAR
jgi:signal transduction histidine kinase